MMSRAEIVDILIKEHTAEAEAWKIAIRLNPEYLEAMDQAAVRRDADELICQHVMRMGIAELCGFRTKLGK